jgi:hypothetical protein
MHPPRKKMFPLSRSGFLYLAAQNQNEENCVMNLLTFNDDGKQKKILSIAKISEPTD